MTASIGSIAQNSTRHRVVPLVSTGAQRSNESQACNSVSNNKGVDELSHLDESLEETVELLRQDVDSASVIHAESQKATWHNPDR